MIVLRAMLLDAYRELNAKRLFWVSLGISFLVVVAYASIGFDANGTSLFFGLSHIESDVVKEDSPIAAMLYRSIFSSFIVSIWLAWIAAILALISTATIFPDFIAGGSIDLVLSKPIPRPLVFLYKYCFGLLFVFVQVLLFCLGVFLCVGWRVGEWNWMIFAAVPLVTFFFSLLYCVCVLLGVLTRSALAALLLTLLFWFSLFSINTAEGMLNQFRIMAQVSGDAEVEATLTKWHRPVRAVQYVLPKTGETIALLDRWLKKDTDVNLIDLMNGNVEAMPDGTFRTTQRNDEAEAQIRLQEEYESRSQWYVLGTSAAFEVVVLALACFFFVRRDY